MHLFNCCFDKKPHYYLCQTKVQITKIVKSSPLSLKVQCMPHSIIPPCCQEIQYLGYTSWLIVFLLIPPKPSSSPYLRTTSIPKSVYASSISGETFSEDIFEDWINRKQMLNLAIYRYISCRNHQLSANT